MWKNPYKPGTSGCNVWTETTPVQVIWLFLCIVNLPTKDTKITSYSA